MEIKIDISKLRERQLMVCTPMYGAQCSGMFARSVADLSAVCKEHGIPLRYYFLFNESLIPRARNYCCDEFMRSGSGHMMFIDADIGFNPMDVIQLMALQNMEGNEYDVIGGPYPKKCISWEKIKHAVDAGAADKDPNVLEKFVGDYVFNPKGGNGKILISEPAEVLEIGTGFMMVKKEAMQKFADSYPQYLYKPDHVRTEHFDGSREIMQFFQAEIDLPDLTILKNKISHYLKDDAYSVVEAGKDIQAFINEYDEIVKKASKRYLSEDYWFCQKAQAAGLKTWLCPWMSMQHVGAYVFGGSLADLASIGASATADPSKLGGKSKKTND